jgi:hypothetical protein
MKQRQNESANGASGKAPRRGGKPRGTGSRAGARAATRLARERIWGESGEWIQLGDRAGYEDELDAEEGDEAPPAAAGPTHVSPELFDVLVSLGLEAESARRRGRAGAGQPTPEDYLRVVDDPELVAELEAIVAGGGKTARRAPPAGGPEALRAAARHLGVRTSLKRLREELGAGKVGALPAALARAARRLGLKVESREGWTLPEILRSAGGGRPVLVCLRDSAGADGDAGHWCVVSGRAGRRVEVHDPATGRAELLAGRDFKNRWSDVAAQRRQWRHYGMALSKRG